MKILIDTLSVSFNYDNVARLLELLSLNFFDGLDMRNKHYSFGRYFSGVLIAWNTDVLGQIVDCFLDISGKGCRYIETINSDFHWFSFLNLFDSDFKSGNSHISRIDVALDLLDSEIPFEKFQKYTLNELYVCRSKCLPKVVMMREETIYFGSSSSDRMLRIYNKALEQNLPDTYWIRMEFQLRNDCAMSFYLNWCLHPDIGFLYRGMLVDYLRFVSLPIGTKIEDIKRNRNQGRLPTAPWWDKLIDGVDRISQIYLPGEVYTLSKLEHYLAKQTYSSLKTYAIAHDGDLSALIDGISHACLNARQLGLLDELKLIRSDLKSR